MPELPEVETIRRQLNARLQGAVVKRVSIMRSGREFPLGPSFARALQGQSIQAIDRRAKLLVWRFESGWALIAHLKMTGRFVFVNASYEPTKHDHVLFSFAHPRGRFSLVWADVRKFGFLRLMEADELSRLLSEYGPEPLEVSASALAERLNVPSTRSIKALLLDQTVLAGVGNIYADEALHRAGIRPMRRASRLSSLERLKLAQEIQVVLQESIDQQGTSANDYVDTEGKRGGFLELLRVYGRSNQPCRTCQSPIKKIVVAQRGTHYCPTCQR